MARMQKKKKKKRGNKKARGGKRVAMSAAKAPEPLAGSSIEKTPAPMPSAEQEYEPMPLPPVEIVEINLSTKPTEDQKDSVILLPEKVELPAERKARIFVERMAAGKARKAAERDKLLPYPRAPGSKERDLTKKKDSKKYRPLKVLSTNHRKMARWRYANPTATMGDMAEKFGYTRGYIAAHVVPTSLWKNYMEDLDEFDAYETSILKNKLTGMGHKAVAVLEDDLDAQIDGFKDRIVRQNAAKDVLNRIDVVGEKDKAPLEKAPVVNLTQVNIKNLSIAEKHDLAARLMSQPVDI